MGYLAEVEVRKYGHRFEVGVDEETAKVLVSIDGGEPENAKALQDGKVVFFGDREIIVKGEIKLIRYVDLADADFPICGRQLTASRLTKRPARKQKGGAVLPFANCIMEAKGAPPETARQKLGEVRYPLYHHWRRPLFFL